MFKRHGGLRLAPIVSLLALLTFPLAHFVEAQSADARRQSSSAEAGGKPQEKTWSVKMSKGTPRTFTVKAKEARLSEIAAELTRLTKVPVTVSPLMSKQLVNSDFGGMNLEATARMLAPQAFIDYVEGGGDAEPKPLAIYLQALNERPPAANESVHGNSEAILIEGNTEDGTDADAQKKEQEDPLQVTFANNQLSVRARKQPLSVVLYKIANEVGVPFELRYESPEVVDVEFDNYTIDQAVKSISPEVRLYYRLDLQTMQTQPLRIVLVAPSAPKT
jgi:hypothetical protein